MKLRSKTTITTLALMALSGAAFSQELSKDIKVEIKNVKASEQQTPQIQVTNVKDKVWRPKKWLELDVDFDAKKAKAAGDTSTMIDSLEVKYFVALNKTDKAGKFYAFTATVQYANVPARGPVDKCHLLMFASPATMARILEKPEFSGQTDIKATGVEFYHGGELCGWESSLGKTAQGRWWADLTKFTLVEGALQPKSKTPFAVLWGDYDIETKPQ